MSWLFITVTSSEKWLWHSMTNSCWNKIMSALQALLWCSKVRLRQLMRPSHAWWHFGQTTLGQSVGRDIFCRDHHDRSWVVCAVIPFLLFLWHNNRCWSRPAPVSTSEVRLAFSDLNPWRAYCYDVRVDDCTTRPTLISLLMMYVYFSSTRAYITFRAIDDTRLIQYSTNRAVSGKKSNNP